MDVGPGPRSVCTPLGRPQTLHLQAGMEIKQFKCPDTEDPLLSCVLSSFNVQQKERKAKERRKKTTLCGEKDETSCPWEVAAVFVGLFVFVFDEISIFFPHSTSASP